MPCPDTASCIQLTFLQYLGVYKNVYIPVKNYAQIELRDIAEFYFGFINILVIMSLIIGVLLYEKKAKDLKNENWNYQVKKKCFICDS